MKKPVNQTQDISFRNGLIEKTRIYLQQSTLRNYSKNDCSEVQKNGTHFPVINFGNFPYPGNVFMSLSLLLILRISLFFRLFFLTFADFTTFLCDQIFLLFL